MRKAFINSLTTISENDNRVMLLTGDLGFSVFENYREKFLDRFINMGVAEINMTGVAAGLAMSGKVPFIYSIIPFVTMRNYEQIRNDLCYQDVNVKIVGVGAGFSYGPYGHTHHGLEDIAILRVLPNITIFSPSDSVEVGFCMKKAMEIDGPVYIRLSRAEEKSLYENDGELMVGKGSVLKKGNDVVIFSTGALVHTALAVSGELAKKGIEATIVSVHTLKPFHIETAETLIKEKKYVITIEEHSVIGGLGSIIAEVIADAGLSVPLVRIGVPDRFTKEIGNQDHMRDVNGLSVDRIMRRIEELGLFT